MTPPPPPPVETRRSGPADTQQLVERERVAALYRHTPVGLIASLGFATLLAWSLAMIDSGRAWQWLALKWLILGGRALDGLQWHLQSATQGDPDRWRRRHRLGSDLDGLSWGLLAPLFLPSIDGWRDGLIVAGLLGVASMGVFTLTSAGAHAGRFGLGTLGPLVLHQLPRVPAPDAVVMCVGILIYLWVIHHEGRRADQRTLELLQLRFDNAQILSELQQALRQAQDANTLKTRFFASVSHELRTPLNGILGMGELIGEEPLNPQQRSRLGMLQRSARHLLTLIGDILDLSRLEAGQLPLQPMPVAPRDLAGDVATLLDPVARRKGLQLEVACSPEVPPLVQTDPTRLRQILMNLLGNAIKFTPSGRITLQLDLDDGRLRCRVIDEGPGVPPQERERIFLPFEQGGAGLQAGTEGSGLGLTTSRQLARAMGGDLHCTSAPGGGGCFVLVLPLKPLAPESPSTPAADPTTPHAAEPPAASPLPLAGMHLLVAEDNPVNALITEACIQALGGSCEAVADGAAALARLQRTDQDAPVIHAVLMDCQMPGLDGWTATRRWRELERAQHEATPGATPLRIVALTANGFESDRQACLEAGMDDFLVKPFTREALVQSLRCGTPLAEPPSAAP